MTHADLVSHAARWLKRVPHCRVVLKEPHALITAFECPDDIGWVRGYSIIIECKASRQDFLADEKKLCRQTGNFLGHWRFYLTLPGIVRPGDIPFGWGLYELKGQRIYHVAGVRYANAAKPPFLSCRDSEVAILLQAVAKAEWEAEELKP